MAQKIKYALGYITGFQKESTYEWDEVIFKTAVLAISIYMTIEIDTILYGYMTR